MKDARSLWVIELLDPELGYWTWVEAEDDRASARSGARNLRRSNSQFGRRFRVVRYVPESEPAKRKKVKR